MDIFEFIVLSSCCLLFISWIVKRQGVASVEGYCLLFLGMAMFTDNLNLLFDYFFQPRTLLLGANEFNFRVYPTVVHIIALGILMAGLFLANPRPESISRDLSNSELDFVAHRGMALVVLGLTLTGFAIYLTGAYNGTNFFSEIDTMRGGDPGNAGGFFYKGADIAVFGMALILSSVRKRARFFLVLLCMLFVSFFLKANKGGLETPILWAAVVLHTYNPRRFWSLARPRIILACMLVAVIGIGIKVQILGQDKARFTFEAVTDSIVRATGTRWGDLGVYRGYCQFINFLPKYHYLFEGYPEGVFALTAWFPRALTHAQKHLPAQGLGFMVHADGHTYATESPAIGLVGSVYADNGFYTLTAYLLIVGFLLGLLRRYAASRQSPLQRHISYLIFALFGGLSAEAGITPILYTLVLAFTAAGLAHLAVMGLNKRLATASVARGELGAV
jgi:hypothetical protein